MKNNKKFMSKKLGAVIAAALLATTFSSVSPVSAAENAILNSTFETGTEGWVAWNNSYIMQASWAKYNGNNSLYICGRQSNFSGALYNLSGKVRPGNSYNISTYWMAYNINNDQDVRLIFTYKDASGNTNYETIAKATAGSNQWASLNGKFTVPSNAVEAAVYFETSKNNCDFFVDDVKITETSGSSQGDQQQGGQQQGDQQQGGQQQGGQQQGDQFTGDYMSNINIETFCPSQFTSKQPGVQYGEFRHEQYYSKTTGSYRGVNIMLPANYNPQKKYPVLYVLHGIFGSEFSLMGNHISEIVGNHVAKGDAKEMIVVLPNMYAATNGVAPSFTDEGVAGYDNFVNDLTNDLMPYVADKYSVSTAREDQAIAGFSMGGREALYIGVTRSDIFGYVMGIAPAPGVTPGVDGNMVHKGQLQENQFRPKAGSDPYALMICCGTADGVVSPFPERYHNILTTNNVKHLWYTIPGAGHDDTAIASGLNNFIPAIFHAK